MNSRGECGSISIITATLNCESDLPNLFTSLRQQTDPAFAHIVIDGGSVDKTWSIVESQGELVAYSVSESDHGLYDALNKGVRAARTDFYLVMGADDILYPNAIADFKEAVRVTGADVVIAGVRDARGIRRGFRRARAWLGHAAVVTSHSVGMLIRKSLHDRFGLYSMRYPVMADGYFIKRLCAAEDVKIVPADFVAGEFGIHGVSNHHFARALCESWQIQLDTGESPLIQYLLFQLRLLRYLPRVIARSPKSKKP
jgi:glycosyltransferase involved in cell wall biosynthesis